MNVSLPSSRAFLSTPRSLVTSFLGTTGVPITFEATGAVPNDENGAVPVDDAVGVIINEAATGGGESALERAGIPVPVFSVKRPD